MSRKLSPLSNIEDIEITEENKSNMLEAYNLLYAEVNTLKKTLKKYKSKKHKGV